MGSFRKPQIVRRYTGGYWGDDGYWHDGAFEEITIMASVQPLNFEERAQYATVRPEGTSQFSAVKIYSNTLLRTAKQGEQEADILVWRGRLWKIAMPEEWQSDVINHYRMIGWEVEPSEADNQDVSS